MRSRSGRAERLGRITLVEEHVATDQVQLMARRSDALQRVGRCVSEEVGAGKGVFVSHDFGHGTTLRRCDRR